VNFLNPWVAAGLAAVVVPLLVLLYFLKLRRREEPIASTLLWRKAVRDLEVNAPFQRLRRNLLLLLQLLVLLAALFALSRPIIETTLSEEESLVILIDRSGSMNTREADGRTRLEDAKEQAVGLVRTLNRTGGDWLRLAGAQPTTKAMVIAFGQRAAVVSPFTSNTTDLVDLIRGIEPTDGASNLEEALTLAQAYLAQTTVELAPDVSKEGSRVVLFSDGGIADVEQASLRYGVLQAIRVGETADNTGITALRVARNFEQPEQVSVFAEVRNFARAAVTTDVSLYVDDRLVAVRGIELVAGAGGAVDPDAADAGASAEGDAPPTAVVTPVAEGSRVPLRFDLPMETGGVVEVRLSRRDALSADNAARVVVPPPRRLSVLLVSAEGFLLDYVLAGQPLARYRKVTPAEYATLPASELLAEGRSRWDVVVFDQYTPESLPTGNYLFVNAAPPVADIAFSEDAGPASFIWWDETHPILRHVALEYVFVAEARPLVVPDESEVLAEGSRGPLLVRLVRDGRQYLMLGFAIEKTNWWSRPSFPVFFQSVLRYLGAAGAVGAIGGIAPGETLAIPLPPDQDAAVMVHPNGVESRLTANAAGVAHFARTEQVGLYRVEPGLADADRFAVNLLNARESDIAPRIIERVGGRVVEQGESIATAMPEIWRWFVAAALIVLIFEWWVYNRRVAI
jgi:hypothetical protein